MTIICRKVWRDTEKTSSYNVNLRIIVYCKINIIGSFLSKTTNLFTLIYTIM